MSANAAEWFGAWLVDHKGRNPHKEFARYELPGKAVVYAGWIRAFDRKRIDLAIATDASVEMQADGQVYPEHHLPKLLKLAGRIKKQRREARDEQRRRSAAEKDARATKLNDRIKAIWLTRAEAERESHREWARGKFPLLARHRDFVEVLARTHWAEAVRESRREKAGA
jgi:hypothetical protein